MKKILFLCTANYYRSRFAEQLFNDLARNRRSDWIADSRGLSSDAKGRNVGPLSTFALRALESKGIDAGSPPRDPLSVAESDLRTADLVIALSEREHRPMLADRFPHWADRIEYWSIDDVDFAPPEIALPMLEREVERLLLRLNGIATRAIPE